MGFFPSTLVHSQPARSTPQALLSAEKTTDVRLANGLRVIIVPDHSAPVYAICVTYNVGSRDEKPGLTGLAHMVEHMMFEGSANVGPGEHFLDVLNNGGGMNGTTSQDRTNFFEVLPKNQLDLGLFLEADRMRSLALNQESFDRARSVVGQEYQLRVADLPYGKSYIDIDRLSYDNFAYQHSVMGEMSELDAATLADVKQFYDRYYGPNNAVLTLVGDFDPDGALSKVSEYFASIPARSTPPVKDLKEPTPCAVKKETLHDPSAPLPQLLMAFHLPSGNTPDSYAMRLLSTILGNGRSSRLYRSLIQEKAIATEVEVEADGRAGPSQFYILASPATGVSVEHLEEAIVKELHKIVQEGVSVDEIAIALKKMRHSIIRDRESALSTAINLGTFAVQFNDPHLVSTLYDDFAAVTQEKVRLAAARYLQPSPCAVVVTLPAQPQQSAPSELSKQSKLSAISGELHSTSLNKIHRLNRAPVDSHVLRVQLPKVRKYKLANGLTVLVIERHRLPTVDFMLWIKPGSLGDPPGLPGLANFTAQMLLEGTTHRTSLQIANSIDRVGATLNLSAEFGSSFATLKASGFAEDSGNILDILSDVVIHPLFSAQQLQQFKLRKIPEIEKVTARPDLKAERTLEQAIYGNFPAANVSATSESTEAMTVADLRSFHAKYYIPANAILGVAGDVTAAKILPLIRRYFNSWRGGSATSPRLPQQSFPASRRVLVVDHLPSSQTHILIGHVGIRRKDPDFLALWIMNRILGGPTGRLFMKLREEEGLAYSANSGFSADTFPGVWEASTVVRRDATTAALDQLFSELEQMQKDTISAQVLEENKRALIARFALSLESTELLLENAMTSAYFDFPDNYWEEYPGNVAKVDPASILSAARKYLDWNHLQIVCVGDAQYLTNILTHYGHVELQNGSGGSTTY